MSAHTIELNTGVLSGAKVNKKNTGCHGKITHGTGVKKADTKIDVKDANNQQELLFTATAAVIPSDSISDKILNISSSSSVAQQSDECNKCKRSSASKQHHQRRIYCCEDKELVVLIRKENESLRSELSSTKVKVEQGENSMAMIAAKFEAEIAEKERLQNELLAQKKAYDDLCTRYSQLVRQTQQLREQQYAFQSQQHAQNQVYRGVSGHSQQHTYQPVYRGDNDTITLLVNPQRTQQPSGDPAKRGQKRSRGIKF